MFLFLGPSTTNNECRLPSVEQPSLKMLKGWAESISCDGGWKGPTMIRSEGSHRYGEILLETMKRNPDLVGQVYGATGDEQTFGEMAEKSIRCALWLRKQNIKSGDVIGICSHNHLNNIIPVLSSLMVGTIFNPWWNSLDVDVMRHLLDVMRPKVIFVSEKNAEAIAKITNEATFHSKVVVFGKVPGLESFDDLLKLQDPEEVARFECAPINSPDQPAMILMTSGTTSYPKGVLHSYGTLTGTFGFSSVKSRKRTNHMCLSEIAWISGVLFPLRAIAKESRMIIGSPDNVLDNLEYIEKYKVNLLTVGTGTAIAFCKSREAQIFDSSSVEFINISGAKLSPKFQEIMAKMFPEAYILRYYGTTETGGAITVADTTNHPESAGFCVTNMEMKLKSLDDDKILGVEEEGVVHVRTPTMMLGYYNDPRATSEVIDSEGWYNSGDLAYCNSAGELFISDRIKEIIRSGPNDVVPGPIEEVIASHPGVSEAAVVSKPHEDDDERAFAFVVKNPGAEVTETQILDLVKKSLPERYKLQGGVKFVEELPKTPSGKIAKQILRQMTRRIAEQEAKTT